MRTFYFVRIFWFWSSEIKSFADIPNSLYNMFSISIGDSPICRQSSSKSGISVHETKDSRHGVEGQISLYDFAPVSVVERLRDINLMEITPSQAFQILEELKESLDD